MRRLFWALCLVLGLMPLSASAAKLQVNDTMYVDVKLLIQVQGQMVEKKALDGEAYSKNLYLRRGRFIMSGALTPRITFFMDTDLPNYGKDGKFSDPMYVQDAFMSFKIFDALNIDTGMIIIPLTHHSFQGATTLNTLDYHAFMVKYPAGKVWRDTGVQLRGDVFKGKVHYRLGVYNGVAGDPATTVVDADGNPLPLNPSDGVRVAGHMRFNVFDAEPGFFTSGILFGKKKIVSLGVGVDYQKNAVYDTTTVDEVQVKTLGDYMATGLDAFVDMPIGPKMEAIFQANLIHYENGEGAAGTGNAFFAEAGYRYGMLEPVVSFEKFISVTGKSDYQATQLGFNVWLKEHAANVKANVGIAREGDFADSANEPKLTGTLQAMLLF